MTRFSLLTLPEVSVLSRRMATLSVVAVILVTATSCTATVPSDQLEVAETVDMCAAAAAPGVASDAVEATGEIGTSASATFASPLAVTSTERTVLVEGDGREVTGTDIVDYALTVYDATSGGLISQEGYTVRRNSLSRPRPSDPSSVARAWDHAWLQSCRKRIRAVPPSGSRCSQCESGDRHRGASGCARRDADGDAQRGRRADDHGAHAEPPAEVELAVLKKGDGPLVAAGDTVLLQYSGVRWSNGKVFDASWSKGAPATLTTTDVIEGYRPALEGQTIGSQVLVVIPPASAYGEGAINDTDLTGETLVFVVDLLASAPPR